ncbi:MAG: polyprenyl synthetase family protein [Desulfovibrionaceae bacterium]|nr:polyprenyl synthetase family protein [Desulfovibrionaceae bacterium]
MLPPEGRRLPIYLLGNPGKGLRASLLLLCAEMFGRLPEQACALAAALELTHAASLLHDDIQDGAALRRGKPCAHLQFGVKEALLAGDALLAAGLRICADFGPSIFRVYTGAVEEMVHGQIMENSASGSSAYEAIIFKKTGSLMGAACEMGAVLAGQNNQTRDRLRLFGRNLGAAYQLADDWRDFLPETATGKDQGGDLLRGNLTLPVRIYLDSLPANERRALLERIQAGRMEANELEAVCRSAHAPQLELRCRERLQQFLNICRESLSALPDCRERSILEEIAEQIFASIKTGFPATAI